MEIIKLSYNVQLDVVGSEAPPKPIFSKINFAHPYVPEILRFALDDKWEDKTEKEKDEKMEEEEIIALKNN